MRKANRIDLVFWMNQLERDENWNWFWKNEPPSGPKKTGKKAITEVTTAGYERIQCRFQGVVHRVAVHRLNYAVYHNKEQFGELDHIDENKLNNHPSNLREVSAQENSRKSKMGKKGWYFWDGKVRARVMVGDRRLSKQFGAATYKNIALAEQWVKETRSRCWNMEK